MPALTGFGGQQADGSVPFFLVGGTEFRIFLTSAQLWEVDNDLDKGSNARNFGNFRFH